MGKRIENVYAWDKVPAQILIEDGSWWYCPVCGFFANSSLPWGPIHEPFASYDICPLCKIEHGVDDYPREGRSLNEQWQRYRINWLNERGWDDEAIARIQDGLGLTRDDIIGQAKALELPLALDARPGAPWPFEDPPDTAVTLTRSQRRPTTWVSRASREASTGVWWFELQAQGPPTDQTDTLTLQQLARRFPDLLTIADLPMGWCATRADPVSPWQREKLSN